MNYEFVYLFTNPAMPDWVKVGRTNCIPRRLADLYSRTAVPLPFECRAYLKVPADKVSRVEQSLHKLLGIDYSQEKEFFRTSPDVVLRFFEGLAVVDPDFSFVEHPDVETKEEKKKAQATSFGMLGVPVGARLVLSRDSSVVCEVVDDKNQVSFGGKTYAISALACEKLGYSVNGFAVFMYEDETLWDRRLRLFPKD